MSESFKTKVILGSVITGLIGALIVLFMHIHSISKVAPYTLQDCVSKQNEPHKRLMKHEVSPREAREGAVDSFCLQKRTLTTQVTYDIVLKMSRVTPLWIWTDVKCYSSYREAMNVCDPSVKDLNPTPESSE